MGRLWEPAFSLRSPSPFPSAPRDDPPRNWVRSFTRGRPFIVLNSLDYNELRVPEFGFVQRDLAAIWFHPADRIGPSGQDPRNRCAGTIGVGPAIARRRVIGAVVATDPQ